ncbi:alpha/beta hydrolase [Streptomyces asiaticus]|uniref:alpha/beta hydrolase n=1 Tax=Streptomyces asiaticus TaxID=114695 RepID=UPI0037F4E343
MIVRPKPILVGAGIRGAARTRKATALLTAAAAVLGTAVTAASAAPVQGSATGLARFHHQEVRWAQCVAPPMPEGTPQEEVDKWNEAWRSMDCAAIKVPKDYRRPGGDTLTVNLTRFRAKNPDQRRGVLFLNPGGPGVQARLQPAMHKETALAGSYDLIGVDPRGTSGPDRLLCDLPPGPKPFFSRPTDAQLTAIEKYARQSEEGCRRAGGDLRPYISTANTARDMDVVRAALGEEKINYLGYSYGTYLGAVYGSLFPRRLDRSVLDSSMHPDWSYYEASWQQSVAARQNVDAWAAWIARRDNTYHLGTSAAEVRATIDELGRRLEKHPLPDPNVPDAGPVDQTRFDLILGLLSAARPRWHVLAQLVNDFREQLPSSGEVSRDASEAMRLLASQRDEPEQEDGTYSAVTCERDWPGDLKAYYRKMRQFREEYPYGEGAMMAAPTPCTFRSFTPPEQPVNLERKGYPTGLVVQNEYDAATKYEGGPAMARKLGHRLISIRDEGTHGVYRSNPCATQKIDDYLIKGRLPDQNSWCEGAPRPDIPADHSGGGRAEDRGPEKSLTSQARSIIKEHPQAPAMKPWPARAR